MNPDAIVVGAGCYVQTAGDRAWKKTTAIDIVIGNNRKNRIWLLCWKHYEDDHVHKYRKI